ncbi:MAG TPA: HAD-IC family P-type ATPase [Candidatus Dormibacteraeota bacterium]
MSTSPGGETPLHGLTAAEVATRVARGQTNASGERTSRSLGEILRANILTRFNFILGTLLVAILAVGQIQDALFGIVLVSNSLIGIVQEIRAKRTLDQLAVLNAPHARVVRDNATREVAVEEVVLDDIVDVHTGDQIVTDGVVRASAGMQVDESLLTGESEPVEKSPDSQVLSGSFVVAGSGRYQATAVGADAYARKLAAEARRFKLAHSELIAGINRILGYITWAIPPIAALLVFSQLHAGDTWRDTVTGTVAGLVGMVPQGLVLLTSIAFGVAAVTLARRKVLVQQLPAVEGLARVDIVCFDKTGTLTDGSIAFDRVERLDQSAPVDAALGALADDENRNTTLAAIAQAFPSADGWVRISSVPFSSARKWSAANFGASGTWILGAPEMVLSSDRSSELGRAADLAATGERVLVLARSDAQLDGDKLPPGVHAVAFVLFAEQVRPDAAETIAYFAQQGVAMKVISGDSPRTVGAVAARVGLPQADEPVDARELPDDANALGAIVEERTVFGRVTPRQKQSMVTALQARGHTVAMTGDGVNDALALKLADIGIAMGSGAPATKSVAQLVLLDGRFATMPGVVAEGRRVTANIERVANVFITKTVWATLLALAVSIALWPYPFLPRHLTIIDTLTIGIPSFFLALAPNLRRYVPGFVGRVLRFTIPAGIVVAASMFAAFWLARSHNLPLTQQRTGATLVALMLSLTVLVILAFPLTWRRAVLVGLMIVSFVLLFPFAAVRKFYALELPTEILGATILIGFAGIAVLIVTALVLRRLGHGPAAAQVRAPGSSPPVDG